MNSLSIQMSVQNAEKRGGDKFTDRLVIFAKTVTSRDVYFVLRSLRPYRCEG